MGREILNDFGLKGQPVVRIFGKGHDRSQFNSGNEKLDHYLKRLARQDAERGLARVYVLVTTDDPQTILGFYTLSNESIESDTLPDALGKKLPRDRKVPVTLLGQFALERSIQGKGMGLKFLANAVRRATRLSQGSASYALVVDALDEQVEEFYLRAGFIRLKRYKRRLILPLK